MGIKNTKKWLKIPASVSNRPKVVILLAAVLALYMANLAAISAAAEALEKTFQIGHTGIGILISIVSLISLVATVPAGILVDRINRTRLLAFVVAIWTVAMLISSLSSSFFFLLIVRAFLGLMTATAYPAVASLTGDFFPGRERARVYGLILAGEFIGSGFGFILVGEVTAFLNWRWAYVCLSVPAAFLALCLWLYLPEPARGGQQGISSEEDSASGHSGNGSREQPSPAGDPRNLSIWKVLFQVLKIRTNLVLIIASALGYYFFAGIQAFAMIYIVHHYHVAPSLASILILVPGIGALLGVVLGGRLADDLLRRGFLKARIVIPGVGLAISVLFFAPAIWTTNLHLAMLLFAFAGLALGAANPSLDAARLDIMPSGLWGRAESIRMVLRLVLESAGPTAFGYTSQYWLGGGTAGLERTFLLMLIPMLIASTLAIPAWFTYPRDVAKATSYERKFRRAE